MACAALGFAVGMIGLAVGGFIAVMFAAMFAPVAIAIACVAYVIDIIAFWWEHT